jgi:hypothetical protein
MLTPEEAIRWARQAGWSSFDLIDLDRFAALAHAAGAAAERAACIEDCNAEARDDGTAQRIVERIRARGEA